MAENRYYVYENWHRKRGRIHLGSCAYCNEGRGFQPDDSGRNGKWHGPFSRNDAFTTVKRLQKDADIQPCAVCKP
jgi:hypothetical protein